MIRHDALDILASADIDIEGRMPWSSNATFLVNLLVDGNAEGQAIYKPGKGDRPLWDFPNGLFRREVAAYRLSDALGWEVVPPTVVRDGPYGNGSLQWFVQADFEQHYFTLHEKRPDLHGQMMTMCAFDLLANNTDRKGGHVLIDPHDDHLWGIDQGLCFAAPFKLRTVIWEFAGEPIPRELLPAVEELCTTVPLAVATLLDSEEIEALQDRAADLVADPIFPYDPTGRRYPWPLV